MAPDRVRPNALREMLARLSPHEFSLASPRAVRGAICRHFAPSFVLHAVEGLASRKPEQSARTRMAFWQRLACCFVPLALLIALLLTPVDTLWGVTASSRLDHPAAKLDIKIILEADDAATIAAARALRLPGML